jgi:transcriptional regulator with XRE-family HTH domain
MITGAQVRAAKALLDWSGSELAIKANVAISTIRRVEGCHGLLESASVKVLQSLKNALEDGGVEFIGSPDDRPGVRLKEPSKG